MISGMGEGLDAFEVAIGGFEAVLLRVVASRWGSPSPCEGWSASDVAFHVTSNLRWVTGLIGSEPPAEQAAGRDVRDHDGTGGAPVGEWLEARRAFEVSAVPEALDRLVTWPFGEKAVDRGLSIFSLEFLVHTWDLAAAAGLEVELDVDLMRRHIARLRPLEESIRGPGMYGPEVTVPPDASEQQQFLAFFGRAPV
jgi:uncharacterized protein (TIGR03086 family)